MWSRLPRGKHQLQHAPYYKPALRASIRRADSSANVDTCQEINGSAAGGWATVGAVMDSEECGGGHFSFTQHVPVQVLSKSWLGLQHMHRALAAALCTSWIMRRKARRSSAFTEMMIWVVCSPWWLIVLNLRPCPPHSVQLACSFEPRCPFEVMLWLPAFRQRGPTNWTRRLSLWHPCLLEPGCLIPCLCGFPLVVKHQSVSKTTTIWNPAFGFTSAVEFQLALLARLAACTLSYPLRFMSTLAHAYRCGWSTLCRWCALRGLLSSPGVRTASTMGKETSV